MLNINTVVLDEIAKNISQQINNDTRFFFERAGKKSLNLFLVSML